MKFLRKKAALAFVTAISLMASSVAPVFAEGSKELTSIPDGDGNLANAPLTAAHRPYLDWRNRTQFDMPSKNVVYVYAKKGETILFGSNVTNASDKSIEAVVHEGVFDYDGEGKKTTEHTDNSIIDFAQYGGASIAVTLPVSKTTAYNPELKEDILDGKKPEDIKDMFRDGQRDLIDGADKKKVYLFKVEENGAGHIANRTQELNGPNGVKAKDSSDKTANGYEPLSFVAPYTGTYSFRFLSSHYAYSDTPIAATIEPKNRKPYMSIDFEEADLGDKKGDRYYEPDLGYVTFYYDSGDSANRYVSIKETDGTIVVPKSDFSDATSYESQKHYLSNNDKNSTFASGSIGFVPLHDNAEFEIVWEKVGEDTGRRRLYIEQDGRSSNVNITDGLNVSTITSIGGQPIEAGKEIRIYVQGPDKYYNANIYEIRYFYDQTIIKDFPAPTKEPIMKTESVDLNDILSAAEKIYKTDQTAKKDNVYEAIFHATTATDGYVMAKNNQIRMGSGKFNSDLEEAARILEFIPKHDNSSVAITWTNLVKNTSYMYVHRSINDTEGTQIGDSVGNNVETKTTIDGLSAGESVFIRFSNSGNTDIGNAAIISIDYTYPDDAASAQADEPAVVSLMDAAPPEVSQSYFWDFYDMKSGKTYYAGELYGDYLKMKTDVGTKGGSIQLKESSVEFTPAYPGVVEAIFEVDKDGPELTITQGGSSATSKPTLRKDTRSTKLTVEAHKPVTLSGNGYSVYLKSIRYTAGSEDMGNFARKVDEPWANSQSEVAAWDVTVATKNKVAEIEKEMCMIGDLKFKYDGSNYVSTNTVGPKMIGGGSTAPVPGNITDEDDKNITYSGLKLDPIKDNDSRNIFTYTPPDNGTLTVEAWKDNDKAPVLVIEENGEKKGIKEFADGADERRVLRDASCEVSKGSSVKIYSGDKTVTTSPGSLIFYKIEFIPEEKETGTNEYYTAIPGRAWSDILFLNAGAYQASIYPKFNVLTKDGFLYSFKSNGIQPYSFIFYSNNRGFLFDEYSLTTEPWANKNMSRLQPLERSFYSIGNDTDVGPAPVKEEKDSDGNRKMFGPYELSSQVLGNYIPVDEAGGKDYTHKIFFNTPSKAAIEVYTEKAALRDSNVDNDTGNDLLKEIEFVGDGLYRNNSGKVHYGTYAVGGSFEIEFTEDELNDLINKGVKNISVVLDFSKYALKPDGKPDTETSVNNKPAGWKKLEKDPTKDMLEYKNKRTISATIVAGQLKYSMTWDGKDGYGNNVPVGEYTNNVATYVEFGTAHFPMLDVEHNPNGVKIQMENQLNISGGKDRVYYNNSAESPNRDSDTEKKEGSYSWLYYNAASSNNANYKKIFPTKIGDGANHSEGISSHYTSGEADGAMKFGGYTDQDTKVESGDDAGYGNRAALDIWTKYNIEQSTKLSIGIGTAAPAPAYVSFVAEEGVVQKNQTTDDNKDLNVSHLKHKGTVLAGGTETDYTEEERESGIRYGDTIKGVDNIFGNTISTGFLTTFPAHFAQGSSIYWDITIPMVVDENDSSKSYGGTYVKLNNGIKTTSLTEAELNAAELYNTFFGVTDNTAVEDDVLDIGDEVFGSEQAQSSESDTAVDMTQGTDETDSFIDDEAAQQFLLTLSAENGGEQKGNISSIKYKTTPVLTDTNLQKEENPNNQIYNAGTIHRVSFEGTSKYKMRIQQKFGTAITGDVLVTIGLVIDNIYAPNATATAKTVLDESESASIYGVIKNAIESNGYQDYLNNEIRQGQYDETKNENYGEPKKK